MSQRLWSECQRDFSAIYWAANFKGGHLIDVYMTVTIHDVMQDIFR
jgi:hypothetical protein